MATGLATPPRFVTPPPPPFGWRDPNQNTPPPKSQCNGRNWQLETPCKWWTGSSPYLNKIRDIGVCSIIDGIGRIGCQIGQGQFSDVFEVEGEQMVLKRYQERRLTTDEEVKERIAFVLEQYGTLCKIAPSCQATIYNENTAVEDGFLLVERIPLPFPTPTWTQKIRLEDLSPTDKKILSQVKELFQILANNNLMVDLKNDNVGLDHDGNVVLFDWHDVPDDRDEFWCHVKNRVNSFARGKDMAINPEIFDYLYPN